MVESQSYLQETTLLSWRYDAIVNCVGLLFDLRYALDIDDATIGVLVASTPFRFDWLTDHHYPPPIWYSLTGLTVGVRSPFSVRLEFEPGAEMSIDAEAAAFFIGTAAISEGAPPDFTHTPVATLSGLLPSWDTEMKVASEVGLITSGDHVSRTPP
ncbi:MAG: hypothetical protein ABI725_02815 [Chloroflexota bacterium]